MRKVLNLEIEPSRRHSSRPDADAGHRFMSLLGTVIETRMKIVGARFSEHDGGQIRCEYDLPVRDDE